MTKIDFIKNQMHSVRERTKAILAPIPHGLWHTMPEGQHSTIAWQAGHIIISQYFNGIACVSGPDKRLYDVFPIKQYAADYGIGSKPADSPDEPTYKNTYLQQMDGVMEFMMQSLDQLDEALLTEAPVLKHPTYNTRGEVLEWTAFHETWHLGQISLLRKALGVPVVFTQ